MVHNPSKRIAFTLRNIRTAYIFLLSGPEFYVAFLSGLTISLGTVTGLIRT